MQLRFDGRAISTRSRHGRSCIDEFPEVSESRSAVSLNLTSTFRAGRFVALGQ
jgi:hypothetical protein